MANAKTKQNSPKLVTASARSLRISPRKMRLVTNLVKNLPVDVAITQLQFTDKKAAPMLVKLLKSAVANAENNFSLKADDLYVKSLTCDMGQTMKRYFPRARGSAFVIRRKLSHVNLILEQRPNKKGKKARTVVKSVQKEQIQDKELATNVGVPDTSETGNEPQHNLKPTAPTGKSSEQRKGNVIQQKRRLFNRKTGV
jgi:large subunit ribosomal protein L22